MLAVGSALSRWMPNRNLISNDERRTATLTSDDERRTAAFLSEVESLRAEPQPTRRSRRRAEGCASERA